MRKTVLAISLAALGLALACQQQDPLPRINPVDPHGDFTEVNDLVQAVTVQWGGPPEGTPEVQAGAMVPITVVPAGGLTCYYVWSATVGTLSAGGGSPGSATSTLEGWAWGATWFCPDNTQATQAVIQITVYDQEGHYQRVQTIIRILQKTRNDTLITSLVTSATQALTTQWITLQVNYVAIPTDITWRVSPDAGVLSRSFAMADWTAPNVAGDYTITVHLETQTEYAEKSVVIHVVDEATFPYVVSCYPANGAGSVARRTNVVIVVRDNETQPVAGTFLLHEGVDHYATNSQRLNAYRVDAHTYRFTYGPLTNHAYGQTVVLSYEVKDTADHTMTSNLSFTMQGPLTATLPVSADTRIGSDIPTSADGAGTWLNVSVDVPNTSTYTQRILLKFDTAAATAQGFYSASIISSATLFLYHDSGQAVGIATALVGYRLSADWTESEATWRRASTANAWATNGGTYARSTEMCRFTLANYNPTVLGWWATTVLDTGRLKSWILNPAQQTGILLRSINESPIAGGFPVFTFAAKENGTPTHKAYVRIHF